MGGEWGVGASLAMEKVPPRLRGLLSGFLQQGYAMGYLLAALCNFFLFPNDSAGVRCSSSADLPALLALFVRMRVKESEVWEKTKHESWGHLGRAIVSHWKLFLYLVVLMTAMNLASHGTQDMYPTFLERQWGFGVTTRDGLFSAFSMVGAIIGGTLFGLLSDKIGRRETMIVSLLGGSLRSRCGPSRRRCRCCSPAAFLMQFFVQGAWGVIPAHLSELSPDSVRGFLPGFGYQWASSSAAPCRALRPMFAHRTSYAMAMAGTAA